MNELVLFVAKVMPEEKIIEEIKECATNQIISGSKDNRSKLIMYCSLLLSKEAMSDKPIEDVIKDMKQHERISERLNSEKQ